MIFVIEFIHVKTVVTTGISQALKTQVRVNLRFLSFRKY